MSPRFEIDPADDGPDDDLTNDGIILLGLATALALGLLTLVGLGSVSAAFRLEAVIARLVS